MTELQMIGTVVQVLPLRNCVFIRTTDAGKTCDYFAHRTALQSPLTLENIREGQQLAFLGHTTTKGPRAEQVRALVVDDAPGRV